MAKRLLSEAYGDIDYEAEAFLFRWSSYYVEEMGEPIYRTFLSFKNLIRPEDIIAIKHTANRLEMDLAVNGKRRVNIDPGYLELGKFILATTKNQQHRIWIGDGIFADNTLYFRDGDWRGWDWTYFDYRSEEYLLSMRKIRDIYKVQVESFIRKRS